MLYDLVAEILEHLDLCMRLPGLQRGIEAAGGTFSTEPQAKKLAFQRVGLLETLPDGAGAVQWCGQVRDGDTTVHLLEHRRPLRSRTIAVVNVPSDWPPLVVSSEHQGYLIDTTGRRNALKLDNVPFNKRWRVWAHDENFALVFLSRDVQQWFSTLPRGAIVHIGLGALSVSVERPVRSTRFLEFARLPAGLLRMLCPELQEELNRAEMAAAA